MEKILLHGDYKDTTMGNNNVTVTKIVQYMHTYIILAYLMVIISKFIPLIHQSAFR
jgi:hypothetical protein